MQLINMRLLAPLILLVSFTVELAVADKLRIDRKAVVQSFNPTRTESSPETPLQVGNGNFAFGVDITGLQTFGPFSTLSTWGWHNFSLPKTPGQTQVSGSLGFSPGVSKHLQLIKYCRLSWYRLVDSWPSRQLQHG